MKLFVRRRDAEALLDGRPLQHDSGLEDVDAFFADMRLELGAMPAPEPRPTLASTLDGRRPLRPATSPTPKPTFPPSRPRSHRLRPAVAVFAAGTVLFGGLAGAGALPDPVQRATAEVTSHLGVELPGAAKSPVGVNRGVEPGTTRTGSPGSQPTTSRPGTSPTTNPTTGTTGPAGASVLPTTPAPPSATISGHTPTPPTVPTVPVPLPKVPLPRTPRGGLAG